MSTGLCRVRVPWRVVCFASLLLLAASVAHSPGLNGAFVFDDVPEIVESERLRQPIEASDFIQSRGLGYATLKFNYATSSLDPWGYHVFNLGVHLATSLMLWAVLYEMLVSRRNAWHPAIAQNAETLAWGSALLWSVHPMTTQAVAYTIQRLESLWSLAFLAGLTAYLVAIRQTTPRARAIGLIISIVAFWSGMLCKEPIVLALVAIPISDRLFGARPIGHSPWHRRLYIGMLVLPILIAIPIVILPSLLTSDKTASGGLFTQVVTPFEYWRTQPEVLLLYVSKILIPLNQCFDYGWLPQNNMMLWFSSTLVVLSVLAISLHAWWRKKPWSCFPLFFFPCVGTTCIVPLIDLAVEHRVYLASAWVIAGCLASVTVLAPQIFCILSISRTTSDRFSRIAIGLLTILLGWFTHERSAVYQSPLELWQDTAITAPWNFRAHVNLASEQLERGDPNAAITNCQVSLTLPSFERQPDHQQAKVFDLLASAFSKAGNVESAIAAAEKAVALTPGGSEHLMRLASVYTEHSLWPQAENALRRAIANRSQRAVLYEHLATVLSQTAQWDAAKDSLHRAIALGANRSSEIEYRLAQLDWILGDRTTAERLWGGDESNPLHHVAITELATWLDRAGRFDERRDLLAITGLESDSSPNGQRSRYQSLVEKGDYQKASEIASNSLAQADVDSDRRFWKVESAVNEYRLGRPENAEQQLEKLRQEFVDDVTIWVASGNVYRWSGQEADALRCYARAIEIDDSYSPALNNLGMMISASDPARAEPLLRRAVTVDPLNVQAWHSLGNTLVRLGRVDEALSYYKRALTINPTFEPSLQTLERLSAAKRD